MRFANPYPLFLSPTTAPASPDELEILTSPLRLPTPPLLHGRMFCCAFCLLFRRKAKRTAPITSAIKATPPMTPPAIAPAWLLCEVAATRGGDGDGDRDIGGGTADDDCELMLVVLEPELKGALDTLVLSAVLEPVLAVSESVDVAGVVGAAWEVEVDCWVFVGVGDGLSLEGGAMDMMDKGKEGWIGEEVSGGGGGGPKVGIAGADIAGGTTNDAEGWRGMRHCGLNGVGTARHKRGNLDRLVANFTNMSG